MNSASMHVENPLKHSTCRQTRRSSNAREEMHFRFEGGATLRQLEAVATPLQPILLSSLLSSIHPELAGRAEAKAKAVKCY